MYKQAAPIEIYAKKKEKWSETCSPRLQERERERDW